MKQTKFGQANRVDGHIDRPATIAHHGADFFPLRSEVLLRLSPIIGVDAKVVGSTLLYTVSSGKLFFPFKLYVRCMAFTLGGKSIQTIGSVGGNSPNYDDIVGSRTFTVSSLYTWISIDPVLTSVAYGGGSQIYFNITTGSDATLEEWAIDLFGYLV